MVAVVKAIHKLQPRMRPLAAHDINDVLDRTTRWLLAEDMKPMLKSGYRDFRSNIVGHTYDQSVEVFRQEGLVVFVIPNPIRKRTVILKCAIAYGDYPRIA